MGRKTKRKKEAETEAPAVEEEPPAAEQAEETPDERIARLESQVLELEGKWLRAQADYKNLRRRGQVDYEAGLQRALQPLLEELLFVLDFLDMALAAPTTTEEAKNLALGVEMTRTKLIQALERANVKPIPTDGPFDPGLHDAADTRDGLDAEPGTIVETVRRGYTWRDAVLRHASVVVAAGLENGDADDESPEPTPAKNGDESKEETEA